MGNPVLSNNIKFQNDLKILFAPYNPNNNDDYPYILDIGDNPINQNSAGIEIKILKEMFTYSSGICYKINISTSNEFIIKGTFQFYRLEFQNSILEQNLPSKAQIYLTSESNSYGIIFNEWLEGNEMKFELPMNTHTRHSALKILLEKMKIFQFCQKGNRTFSLKSHNINSKTHV